MKIIYIVQGTEMTPLGVKASDFEWVVCAYEEETSAKRHTVMANLYAVKFPHKTNPYDQEHPPFTRSGRNAHYSYYPLELRTFLPYNKSIDKSTKK